MTLSRYKKQLPGWPQPAIINGTERNDLDAIDAFYESQIVPGAPTRGKRAVRICVGVLLDRHEHLTFRR